jgi:SlyX protein
MSDAPDIESRLKALEELTAHQVKALDEISSEMAAMAAELRALQAKFDVLVRRFAALEEDSGETPPITQPPHW